MKKILLLIFAVCSVIQAQETFFKGEYPLWKDGEILIWTTDPKLPLKANELCLSVRRVNSEIGIPDCRVSGEWERDSLAALYAGWLTQNTEAGTPADLLRARNAALAEKFYGLEDKILLFVTERNDSLFVLLFNEKAAIPQAGGFIPKTENAVTNGDAIAKLFFKGTAGRRLSKEERDQNRIAPDSYFAPVPRFHSWFGIAFGYSQAQIPFTPDSWYRNKLNSRIKNYRETADSLSLWNFLKDDVPLFTFYAGGTWFGIIGAELFLRYSKHDVKIDTRDTIYNELDHWYFNRYEVGLNVHVMHRFHATSFLDILPYASLGFNYSFFSENIGRKSSKTPASNAYTRRIELEPFYKGPLFSLGSHFVFLGHYGLDLRAGLVHRGDTQNSDSSVDEVAETTLIGGSTFDCFISLGLEYHFTIQ